MAGPRGISVSGSVALPNGAAATNGAVVDLSAFTMMLGDSGTLTLVTPTMNSTLMPNGKTMIYQLQGSSDADFYTYKTHAVAISTQTGAGGTGAAGATVVFTPPRKLERFLRVIATGSASGNASGATATYTVTY